MLGGLGRFIRGDDTLWAGGGTKDSLSTVIFRGIIWPLVPIGLAIWVVVRGSYNLAFLLNRGRGRGARYPDSYFTYDSFGALLAAVLVLLGIAGMLISYYGIANLKVGERWYWPAIWASRLMALAGFVLFMVSSLMMY